MPKKLKFDKRICNLVPSKDTERDWRFDDALQARALGAAAAIPRMVDLREPTWWTINDQGNTGSCVGWATADGVVRYQMVKAGKLAKPLLLSARYVWMSSKETDVFELRPESFLEAAGTTLKAAVDIARKYGVVTDKELPFKIVDHMYVGSENAFYAIAAQRRITSYFNLGKNLAQWRAWIAAGRPILAGLSVDQTWDDATRTGGNLDSFQPGTVRGGHAAAIVGYTPDRFIVRNSWGTGWGDKGFGYATDSYIADAFFNESYGITV